MLTAPDLTGSMEEVPRAWVVNPATTIYINATIGRYTTGALQGYVDNIGAGPNLAVVGVARQNGGALPSGHLLTMSPEVIADELIVRRNFPAGGVTTAQRNQMVYGIDSNSCSFSPTAGPPVGCFFECFSGYGTLSSTVGWVGIGPSFVGKASAAALGAYYQVRGVAPATIANLSAFVGVTGGTPVNGITYNPGDRILCPGQGAASGIYIVGAVAGGVAPLTPAPDMPTGMTLPLGAIVDVGPEGTYYGGSTWKSLQSTAGGPVIGTNDPKFYPRSFNKTVQLPTGTTTGVYTIGAGGGAEPLYLFSTTASVVSVTRNTAGTPTATTGGYAAPVASRIAGTAGTAAVQVVAQAAAGTTNTADTSTLDVAIVNW